MVKIELTKGSVIKYLVKTENIRGGRAFRIGYYCSECGMKVIDKCSSHMLNDLKVYHPEYPFIHNSLSHNICGCKLYKCPYMK